MQVGECRYVRCCSIASGLQVARLVRVWPNPAVADAQQSHRCA
jgi:hypothetical protein